MTTQATRPTQTGGRRDEGRRRSGTQSGDPNDANGKTGGETALTKDGRLIGVDYQRRAGLIILVERKRSRSRSDFEILLRLGKNYRLSTLYRTPLPPTHPYSAGGDGDDDGGKKIESPTRVHHSTVTYCACSCLQ